jgi:cobalt-zinc-cadmium efflux system outer membrane protein
VTIEALVAETLRSNPEIAFYEAEIAAASGERRQAGAWENPAVGTEVGRKRVREAISTEGTVWALSAEQTFEWPGRVSLRKVIADQQVQLAKLGLEQFKLALAGEVRQKAYAALAAQKRAAAADEVTLRAEELVATVVQRESAGVNPLLETRAIEAASINLKTEVVEARKEANAALLQLNLLRGSPLGSLIQITESEIALPEPPSIEALLRQAAESNFQLKQRELELAQQGFKVRLAKNEVWPSISLVSQVSREEVGNEVESEVTVGVSLPLPLWNNNQGNITTAKSREVQAATTLMLEQREIERQLREHYGAYEANRRELLRLDPKAAEKLREAAQLADRHYRLGAVPLATYLEVQESYVEALTTIYTLRQDAMSSALEIQLLTGKSF